MQNTIHNILNINDDARKINGEKNQSMDDEKIVWRTLQGHSYNVVSE